MEKLSVMDVASTFHSGPNKKVDYFLSSLLHYKYFYQHALWLVVTQPRPLPLGWPRQGSYVRGDGGWRGRKVWRGSVGGVAVEWQRYYCSGRFWAPISFMTNDLLRMKMRMMARMRMMTIILHLLLHRKCIWVTSCFTFHLSFLKERWSGSLDLFTLWWTSALEITRTWCHRFVLFFNWKMGTRQ